MAYYSAFIRDFLSIFLSIFNFSPGAGHSNEKAGILEPTGSANRWVLLALSIHIVFIMPTVEEYLFRGFLFGTLRAHYGLALSSLLTSFMFMLAHVLNPDTGNYYLMLVFLDSIFLCLAREKTGNIYIPSILHIFMNLWVMI